MVTIITMCIIWFFINLALFAAIGGDIMEYKNYHHYFWIKARKNFNIVGSIIIEILMTIIALPFLVIWYIGSFAMFSIIGGVLLSVRFYYLLFAVDKNKRKIKTIGDAFFGESISCNGGSEENL